MTGPVANRERGAPRGAMSLPDIVSAAFMLLVRYARQFLFLSIVGATLSALVLSIPDLLGWKLPTSNTTRLDAGKSAQALSLLIAVLLVNFLADALLVPAALEAVLGRTPSLRSAFRTFRSTFVAVLLVWLVIVVSVGLLGATVLLFPIALFLIVRWSFVIQVICNERAPVRIAIGRSWSLVRGTWWRVFLIQIAILLLSFLPSLVVQPITRVFNNGAITFVLLSIAGCLVAPFAALGRTLLYADVRLRKGERNVPGVPAGSNDGRRE